MNAPTAERAVSIDFRTQSATAGATGRVLVLTPRAGGGISQMMHYLEQAVEGRRDPWRFDFFVTHDRSLRSSLSRFPRRLWRFARLCARGDLDLCHINVSCNGSTIRKSCYAAICRRYGIPYVLHLHGGAYPEYLAHSNPLVRRAIERLFRSAARVFVLGSTWFTFVRDQIGVPADRIAILPNAVPARSEPTEVKRVDPPLIVFVGLLHEEKGVDTLLEALRGLDDPSLSWQAKLLGGGDVEGYRARIAQLGLQDRVLAPGWTPPEQVRPVLARASIFVLPSFIENLPMALLEGMSYGLCPVVTPVGAVPEVVQHGVCGLIVPVGDSQALADALRSVLRDRALMRRLGRASQARFKESYDIATYVDRLMDQYSLAIGSPPRG
ncbi:MAG TPA: glycosyltransferase family 4 protein [Steroidobacteraceae bacterium]|nr:glycosyltransferase family 4 protein [Steroidobacteraceae bacterium]